MAQLRQSGFVHADTLEWEPVHGHLVLLGEIACNGYIIVKVHKTLAVLDGEGSVALVQTIAYSYNAFVKGHGTFLRIDNAHAHPGHADAHHRHLQDWQTGNELPGSPFWVGADGWQTLGDFLSDVRDWYWEHRSELPKPDSVPPISIGTAR